MYTPRSLNYPRRIENYQPPLRRNLSRSFATASNTNPKYCKILSSRSNQIKSWEQRYYDVIDVLEAKSRECKILKQQNQNLITSNSKSITFNYELIYGESQKQIRKRGYDIQTPRNSDNYPSECDQPIIIDDIINEIVSDQGIETTDKNIRKILKLLPNLIMVLNIMKKIIALFSTIFMIDCKLTGEGHFGIDCIDQVRVLSADNWVDYEPNIVQNGKEISIHDLNAINECLLPFCSCIHPSTLRWNKIKNPELYARCFQNQCDNPDNICVNKPNNSKCMMKNRMCADINDWCNPRWYPSELPAVQFDHSGANEYIVSWDGEPFSLQIKRPKFKLEFDIDCDNGEICCRFLLGSDVTKEYYLQYNIEVLLKQRCYNLYWDGMGMTSNFIYIEQLKFIAPGYIHKDYIENNVFRRHFVAVDLDWFGAEEVIKRCNKYGALPNCSDITNPDVPILLAKHIEFLIDLSAGEEEYQMCVKVKFIDN